MTKTYIAVGSVGETLPGQEVKGLDADRIQALLVSGAIVEQQEPEQAPVDNSAAEIAELKAELKTALGHASKAEAQNVAYVKEIEALKAEIAELKKPVEVTIAQDQSAVNVSADDVAKALKETKSKAK